VTNTDDHLSSSRAVVRSGVFNLAGFVVSAAYMFVLVPVAVHYMGMEQYGLWTIVMAITGYIGLADLGLSTSFVTYIARFVSFRAFDDAVRVVYLGVIFYIGVTVLMFGISLTASSWLFDFLRLAPAQVPAARTALLLAVALFGVTSVSGVLGNTLAAIQRMDVVNGIVTLTLAIKLVVIVIVLMNGGGVAGLLIADFAITAAGMPVFLLFTRRLLPELRLGWKGYDHRLMMTLLRFGAQLQVSRLAEMVQTHFDKFLLLRFAGGLQAAAMYDFGSRPAGRVKQLPVTAIASLVSAVSALDTRDDNDRIHAALVRATRYLAILAAPLFGIIVALALPVMQVWLGPGHERAALTLQFLSIGFFVNVVVSALALISQGRGEPQFQMRAMLLQTILNIALSLTLVLTFGYFGAVVGTTLSTITGGLFFFWRYGRRLLPHPLRFLVSLIWKPVAAAALVSVVGGLTFGWANVAVPEAGRGLLAAVVILWGIVMVVLYAAMLRWLKVFGDDDWRFFRGALPARLQFLLGGNGKS
jgi:O-antigen/teichoic acid export membrane protein